MPLRVLIASVMAFACTSLAQQAPISLADAAAQGQSLFQQSGSTGMVLVVVRNHEVLIQGYGESAPGSGHAPGARSLVRLCSISKVLATDVLARLVADGTVSLDDPLQQYAPRGKRVPVALDGGRITLLNLATHTAGLPREVSAYPRHAPHFTFPDFAQRWAWLPRQHLLSTPGAAALYSNIGFDLLGDALASASGKPYAQLLHDRLLHPLNMWDTTLVPSAEQCSRLLQGSRDEGPCTDTQPSGSSGGVYSTPTDMVKFLQYRLQTQDAAQLTPPALTVYLNPADLKSVQGLSHAGDPTGIGLAWIQIGDPATPSVVYEKTGGGAGFTTYIALSPARKTGVFLAMTWGEGKSTIDFFHESNNLLAALAGVPPLPERIRPVRPARRHAKPAHRRPHPHQSN